MAPRSTADGMPSPPAAAFHGSGPQSTSRRTGIALASRAIMTQPSAHAFAAGMIAQERWRGCGAGGLARSRLRDRNETGARMGRRMSGDLRAGSADVEMDLVGRSEEHTSELQSLMRISYAVFCLKKKTNTKSDAKQDYS